MTNNFEDTPSAEVKSDRSEKTARVSRRRMRLFGNAGLAGLAATMDSLHRVRDQCFLH